MNAVAADQDEYYVESETLQAFIAQVKAIIIRSSSPSRAVEALREPFARLLADPSWLPQEFRQPAPQSGMGGGIGQWLLYRSADRSLTLFSLVVPPGSATPVHDHLAWGWSGSTKARRRSASTGSRAAWGRGTSNWNLPPSGTCRPGTSTR